MRRKFGGEIVKVYDTPAPILGYRWWAFDRCSGYLRSSTFLHRWNREVEAESCATAYAQSKQWRDEWLANRQAYRCDGPPCTKRIEEPVLTLDYNTFDYAIDGIATTPTPLETKELRPLYMGEGCGIYAMQTLEALASELRRYDAFCAFTGEPPVVVGAVELAGKVVVHKNGYRAQSARVAKIISVSFPGISIKSPNRHEYLHLAELYGVPLEAHEPIPMKSLRL